MNTQQTLIAKKILDFLHDEEGRQVHSLTIHGEIGGLNACSSADFNSALEELNRTGFVIRVKTKFRGEVWNISDAGEAARLEM